ncbi:HNH endonuclease [Schinkia azotoformans]|uniref:HNH domain-containing protein n=1 Tax=Schinkia azotoformans LMG 9581 TaxID=1131731 RepID=K6D4S8_SCHAZ|nr:HNH endonuclease [Schinkia azotoformans]EKN63038.1 hypothetical protein BAZO_18718 [Schinkia azotoformans LMG 9581]MEC1639102.1 HNH endonuclease [Schinkia azotoformans]MEC1945131.1 HNH endonuclease [Schinkia azotoformans]
MRNLLPYSLNHNNSLIDIIDSKQEPRKGILVNALNEVSRDYSNYLSNVNNLEMMNNHVKDYERSEDLKKLKEALIHCYDSTTSPLDKLKANIKKAQPDDYAAFCQYCGIGIPSTFDHYLPKSNFPEFSVLGINLFPCCSDCNREKNDRWINDNGIREFLNLYYDSIDNYSQFLYCEITVKTNIPVARFFLEKPTMINQQDYQVIEKHYNNLGLLSKYSLLSNGEIKKAISNLRRKYQRNGTFDIKLELTDHSDDEAEIYGVNYWKASLYQGMANSTSLIQLIKSN